ncbi:MAG: DUF2189 domain-containing protein [Paracoccaceae bacterium]
MTEASAPPPSRIPELRDIQFSDLRAALGRGWADYRRAPAFGLFFSAVYVAGGLLLYYALATTGKIWWSVPVTVGFPILGPFTAVGLYEVSRRLERGEPLVWSEVLGVIFRQKDRQIPSMSAIVVVFFLFWNFIGHMIFALFLGLQVMTNVSSSFAVYLTPAGLSMLAVGTAVGAAFALVLFALTVISLPLLLDREVDFVTAMITSLRCVIANPVTMLSWGALITVSLFLGMAPAFLGLFIVLPVLGHASWHLYRLALDDG